MKVTKDGTQTVIKIILLIVGCTIFVWFLWRKGPVASENNTLSVLKQKSKKEKEKKKEDTKISKNKQMEQQKTNTEEEK